MHLRRFQAPEKLGTCAMGSRSPFNTRLSPASVWCDVSFVFNLHVECHATSTGRSLTCPAAPLWSAGRSHAYPKTYPKCFPVYKKTRGATSVTSRPLCVQHLFWNWSSSSKRNRRWQHQSGPSGKRMWHYTLEILIYISEIYSDSYIWCPERLNVITAIIKR